MRPPLAGLRRGVLAATLLTAAAIVPLGASAQAAITFTPWPGSPFQSAPTASPGTTALLGVVSANADARPDLVRSVPSGPLSLWASPALSTGAPVTYPGQILRAMRSADVDGDGRADLVASAYYLKDDERLGVLRGTVSGLQHTSSVIVSDSPVTSFAVTDVTGDGRADAIYLTGLTTVLRPSTGTAFDATLTPVTASTPSATAVYAGDIDGNGLGDVMVAGVRSGVPYLLPLVGATLTPSTELTVGGSAPLAHALADVTADGRADAIVIRSGSVEVYPGQSGVRFGAVRTTSAANLSGAGVAIADFDGDGQRDLVLATTSQTELSVLRGLGDGTFAPAQPITLSSSLPTGAVGELAAPDLDADGDPDLAIASRGQYRLDVLLNASPQPPTATTAAATAIGVETATLNGTADLRTLGGSARFEYGTTTAYGAATDAQTLLPAAPGAQAVTAALTGLAPDTEYHARLVVTTAGGTANGPDITFRTTAAPAADHTAGIDAPERAVAGVPVALSGRGAGASFAPYTYRWAFDDGASAEGAQVTHGFAPVTDGGAPRRGTRTITLTVRDRFGRQAVATRQLTVLPNRPPVADLRIATPTLEYASTNTLFPAGVDPDDPDDRVVRNAWSYGPGVPEVVTPEKARTTLVPWRVLRRGQPTLVEVASKALAPSPFVAPGLEPVVAAAALRRYGQTYCGAKPLSMTGCWPHPTEFAVGLRVEDGAGATDSTSITLPVRLRARPAADMSLDVPGAQTDGPGTLVTQPISTETELRFDPSATTVDRASPGPAIYVLQVGEPWFTRCVNPAIGPADQPNGLLIDPSIIDQANTIVTQVPGSVPALDLPELTAGELGQRSLRVARRASTAGAAPLTQGQGCVGTAFGVNAPIATVVTGNPADLRLRIPKAGRWSAQLTAYDRIGASSSVRLDAIKVLDDATTCQNISGRRVGGNGPSGFAFSGTCVDGKVDAQIYWTRQPIQVNGLQLAPAPGAYLVVEGNPARISSATVPPPAGDTSAKAWKRGGNPPVSLVVDGQAVARIKTRLVPPIRGQGAPPPTSSGVFLNGRSNLSLPAVKAATYGGLPFAGDVRIDLSAGGCGTGGGSVLSAQLQLPAAFDPSGASGTTTRPTSPLELRACTKAAASRIGKVTDALSGQAPGTATKAVRAAGRRTARAARAAVGGDAASIDLGGLSLGPLDFPSLVLTYDPASRTFRGEGTASLFGTGVKVRLGITDGELTEAGGTVGEVPIPNTPVALRNLSFDVQTTPTLRLVGATTLTTQGADIVSLTGTIAFTPSPFSITIEGTGKLIGSLEFARMNVRLADGVVAVGGQFGKSVGPFSFQVGTSGAFSSQGFNVEASGNACVFACVGVNGVVSDRGAALCGSIDVLVGTLRPGIGLIWKPFDVDAYLDGCSVAPYRSTVVATGASATRTAVGDGSVSVAQGQRLLTVVASTGVAGQLPRVVLTGPGGRIVASPPDATGDAQLVDGAAGTLVDLDRLTGTTRIVVADPKPGQWSATAAGTPTPATLQWGRDVTLPSAKAFDAAVQTPSAQELRDAPLFGSLLTSTARPVRLPTNPKRSATKRVNGKRVTVALPVGQRLKVGDLGPDLQKLVRTLEIRAKGLQPGDTVTFLERGGAAAKAASTAWRAATEPGAVGQSIAAFTVPSSGELRASLAFLPAVNGERGRRVDAFVTAPNGVARGIVKGVDTFNASAVQRPAVPVGARAVVRGRRIQLRFGAAPSVGLKSTASQLVAVVRSAGGGVQVIRIEGRDFRRTAGGYAVTIPAAGAPAGATVKLIPVGLGGRLGKARAKTVVVRR